MRDRSGRRWGDYGRGDDDDVTVAIRDDVTCVGVGGAEVARMKVRVIEGRRVLAGTKELSDLIARRVPADFVESHRVATAVHLKRDLSTPDNRYFFRREMVDFLYEHGSAGPPIAPS